MAPPVFRGLDRCSAAGAQQTADELIEFWRKRGFRIKAWHEASDNEWGVPVVRSNLVAGMPPRGSELRS